MVAMMVAITARAEDEPDPYDMEFDAELEVQPSGYPDPLEKVNRGTLQLNQGIDHWFLGPVTRAYGYAVPDPGKRAVRRVLTNLRSPAVFANDLLQGEFSDALVCLGRFLVNTTVGVAGVFDPASSIGLPEHESDFGQTLARAGIGSGPYLVLPIFGPTTVRDGFGSVVDVMFRPTTYVLGGADQLLYATIEGGSSGLVTREEHDEDLRRLEESSIDYYAAIRNAYYQTRTESLRERSEPATASQSEPAPAAQQAEAPSKIPAG